MVRWRSQPHADRWLRNSELHESVDTARVIGALRAQLPPHMVPRRVIPMLSLPRNPNGKIDRTALSQRFQKGAGGA